MSEESVFEAARAIADPAERAAFLDRRCAGNDRLRRDIEALLQAADASSPLDRPPADLARTGAYEPADDGPPAAAVGDRIGPYRLMEQIGEGGFGLVFVAEQSEPVRRKVALKVLKPGMDTRDVVARFEAERQALALMDHPNIARVLDAGSTPQGRPYFVMELVRGVPVTEFCDAHKLPPKDRLNLFVQVCQAVQHAHQKGVIHRDIKPSNILVASHDGVPVPKVIDFGVAKAVGQSLTDKTVYTRFAQMIGTPLYMSPEQAELSGLDVDTRTDVYALGVLLYELLTGTTPFDRKRFSKAAYDEIRRIIREEEPPRPSTRLTSLGETLTAVSASRGTEPGKLAGVIRGELDWIVMRCLEKDRNRRYDTAAGLAKDVQRFLSGDAVEACPPTLGYRLWKAYRRNRAAVVVTGAFVGVVAGAGMMGALLAVQARRAQRAAEDAEGQAIRERDAAVAARAAEAEQRQKAEELVARIAIDRVTRDLKLPGDATGAYSRGTGRQPLAGLCQIMSLPMSQPLRENLALQILAAGQRCCTLLPGLGEGDPDYFWYEEGAFSDVRPDGRAAVKIVGEAAKVWDTTTGRTLVLRSGDSDIASAAFQAEGRVIVTTDLAGRVVLWDAATGALRCSFASDGDPRSLGVFVNSSGDRVITRRAEDHKWRGPIRLWDGRTGALIREIAAGDKTPMEFNPDGTVLLTVAADRATMQAWASADGRLLKTLGKSPGTIAAVGFDPTGTMAAALTRHEVRLWETKSWEVIRTHPAEWVFRAEDDIQKLRVFSADVVSFADQRSVVGGKSFDYVVLALSGDLLVTTDGTVADARTGQVIPVSPSQTGRPNLARFAPDGRFVALPSGRLIDTQTGFVIELWDSNTHWIGGLEGIHNFLLYLDDSSLPETAVRHILLPRVDQLPDPETLALWGRVVARGELDAFGEFKEWDEPTWEVHRQELVRRARPMGRVPFPGPAGDPLYWAKRALNDDKLSNERQLPLLNRIVAAEPVWQNYHRRAQVHFALGRIDLGAADEYEAGRLAGPNYWRDQAGSWCPDVVLNAGRPAEDYRLAVRSLEASRAAGRTTSYAGGGPVEFLLATGYGRAGRHAEALDLWIRQLHGPAARGAVAGLTTPAALYAVAVEPWAVRREWLPPAALAYRAMAQFHLGDRERAAASLAFARRCRALSEYGPPVEQVADSAIAEAARLIEGGKP